MLSEWVNDLLFPAPTPTYTKYTPGFVEVGMWRKVAAFGINLDQAETVLLYCHGNGEDAYCAAETMRMVLPLSCGILVPDYQGYGLTEGVRCEHGCVSAAVDAYDWLTTSLALPPEQVVIAGFSLGTGVAIQLAAQHACKGLALFAPFLNGRSLIEHWVGNDSAEAMLGVDSPFPSDQILKTLDVPLAVVHGKQDDVIPFEFGQKVYKSARKPVGFHEVTSRHNDLFLRLGAVGFSKVICPLGGMPGSTGDM